VRTWRRRGCGAASGSDEGGEACSIRSKRSPRTSQPDVDVRLRGVVANRERRLFTMRKPVVSSLSLPLAVARESSAVAKELGKSRSELFKEAIEAYLRLYRFRKLQQTVAKAGAKRGVSAEKDQVDRVVHEYRRQKRA